MTTETAESIAVGIAEIRVSRGAANVLVAYGLGSCVAVCAYDPASKVAGMAHVMLPQAESREDNGPAGKYANTAIPMLLDCLTQAGAERHRLVVKIVGGAQMLAGSGLRSTFNVGARNAEAVRCSLAAAGIRIGADDTGGNYGRTVQLHASTGKTVVRTVGGTTEEI